MIFAKKYQMILEIRREKFENGGWTPLRFLTEEFGYSTKNERILKKQIPLIIEILYFIFYNYENHVIIKS